MRVWQRLVARWSVLVFGDRHIHTSVRVLRLLEEVVELAQAEHVGPETVFAVVRQVYDRPRGVAAEELGGVTICLAAYAETAGMDLEEAFWDEFERIMDPAIMERVRERNLRGDKIGMQEK